LFAPVGAKKSEASAEASAPISTTTAIAIHCHHRIIANTIAIIASLPIHKEAHNRIGQSNYQHHHRDKEDKAKKRFCQSNKATKPKQIKHELKLQCCPVQHIVGD
jgi:hypothetical protein